jgi:hypothetical protein
MEPPLYVPYHQQGRNYRQADKVFHFVSVFINSEPIIKQHLKCKGWVFECHVNGWKTRVEPTPLNLMEEVAMRLAGRKVYQILGTARPILVERSAWHIAKMQSAIVLVEHSCQTPEIFEPLPIARKSLPKEPQF